MPVKYPNLFSTSVEHFRTVFERFYYRYELGICQTLKYLTLCLTMNPNRLNVLLKHDLAVLVMHLDRVLFLIYSTKSLIAQEECRATSPNQ